MSIVNRYDLLVLLYTEEQLEDEYERTSYEVARLRSLGVNVGSAGCHADLGDYHVALQKERQARLGFSERER